MLEPPEHKLWLDKRGIQSYEACKAGARHGKILPGYRPTAQEDRSPRGTTRRSARGLNKKIAVLKCLQFSMLTRHVPYWYARPISAADLVEVGAADNSHLYRIVEWLALAPLAVLAQRDELGQCTATDVAQPSTSATFAAIRSCRAAASVLSFSSSSARSSSRTRKSTSSSLAAATPT